MSALAAIKDFPILSVCAFPLAWLTWYNNIIHIYSFVAGIMSQELQRTGHGGTQMLSEGLLS